jgi:hypothetical protein
MNNERDPLLESLFSQAERELVEDEFTMQVMAGLLGMLLLGMQFIYRRMMR